MIEVAVRKVERLTNDRHELHLGVRYTSALTQAQGYLEFSCSATPEEVRVIQSLTRTARSNVYQRELKLLEQLVLGDHTQ